jgi:hypothetical protein
MLGKLTRKGSSIAWPAIIATFPLFWQEIRSPDPDGRESSTPL